MMLGLVLLCAACQPKEKVIEYPKFGIKASRSLEITKIVMNDTATILYAEAYGQPGNWVRVDSGMYIREGGKNYGIERTVGMPLHDKVIIPDSGKVVFQMVFPSINRSAREIDMIEGKCNSGGWHIWNIQLREDAAWPTAERNEAIKQLETTKDSGPLAMDWGVGSSKINLHLLGYRPEMGRLATSLYVNETLTGDQAEYTANADSNGVYHYQFDVYGTTYAMLSSDQFFVSFFVAPGEDMDIYLDLYALSRKEAHYLQGMDFQEAVGGTTGKYAALNGQLMSQRKNFRLVDHNQYMKEIAGMKNDEYVGYLMENYRKVMAQIDSANLSADYKEVQKEMLKGQVVYYMEMGSYFLPEAFREAQVAEGNKAQSDYKVEPFTTEQWAILEELDLNNDLLYLSNDVSSIQGMLWEVKARDLKAILGTDKGSLFDMQKVLGFSRISNEMTKLDKEQLAVLDGMENPFYKEAFTFMEKRVQEKLEANKSKTGYRICDVPKVKDNKLFEAILAPYKGKVVFVDVWATWCGPCRRAIREVEPLKESVFSGKDIVFVYITGESSPMGAWTGMIPDIKGDHYRLGNKQWEYVCNQFGIRGIPSYILVDKSGKYALRDDLRDHNMLKKVLLNEASL